MAESLYITATESRSGKSLVSLGVMDLLLRKRRGVAFFRPIINSAPCSDGMENDLLLFTRVFGLNIPCESMYAFTAEEADALWSSGREEEIFEGIFTQYQALIKEYGFVLCEGTDFASATSAFEFDINAQIARNLNSPVLLVTSAWNESGNEVARGLELAVDSLRERGCDLLGMVVNRVAKDQESELRLLLQDRGLAADRFLSFLPEAELLSKPTVAEIQEATGAKLLYGQDQLNRHVYNQAIGAMHVQAVLPRLEHGSLIITPGDRADVIIACLAAVSSQSMESISGMLLTGGFRPEAHVRRLIEGMPHQVPILAVGENTFPAATAVNSVKAQLKPGDSKKISLALSLCEEHLDGELLSDRIVEARAKLLTPRMFQYYLAQKAKAHPQRIVLPEGTEERILRAAEVITRRGIAQVTLLGASDRIRDDAKRLRLDLEGVEVVDPTQSLWREEFRDTYHDLRRHKGVNRDMSRDALLDVNYFGTMMVHLGKAGGMVSGAAHTTAATIRPAFEIIKAQPGVDIVSSVFFICLEDRVLVYGDCAINPNPSAQELAQIALSSARTAATFGIGAVVALLSYSTGTSGRGASVDKVREAARLAREAAAAQELAAPIEGPIQYDAAIDPGVGRAKLPGSQVAGRATVFIFPDLNTGNNTYKAVQRSTGASAIGPVLQGLRRPVNDLSRGCTVEDIINTVAITAIQAKGE